MANYVSIASGNFNTSSTWSTVDTTSLNDTESANLALTTSFQLSTAFTPGAITISGIAVKIASRAAGSPSNTITVQLDQAGVLVTGTAVTMNVSDIGVCAAATNEGGWYVFSFSPVTLSAATAYTVAVKLSATTTAVNLYSTSSANWARMLLTTTNGTPSTSDIIVVAGNNTGAGTGNSYVVTMDTTAATVYGSVTSPYNTVPSCSICKGGTLVFATAAATTYQFNIKGITRVFYGGTLSLGQSGARVPQSGAAKWIITPTANVDSGLIISNFGILNVYGDNTYGNNVVALLAADLSAAGTTCTTNIATGWKNGDNVVFASTTTTAGQIEKVPLTSDASGTTLTFSGGVANAHSGTSPTQGEVANLTRNVLFTGTSTSIGGYMFFDASSVVNMSYYEITFMGSGTAGKTGFDVRTVTGTFNIDHGSHHDFGAGPGFNLGSASPFTAAISVSYTIVYNMSGIGWNMQPGATNTVWTMDHVWIMKTVTQGVYCNAAGGNYTNITITSAGNAWQFDNLTDAVVTFNNFTSHSNSGAGTSWVLPTITNPCTNFKIWRNNSTGLGLQGCHNTYFNNLLSFGNNGTGIAFAGSPAITGPVFFDSAILASDTTFNQPSGIGATDAHGIAYFTNSTFGVTSGIFKGHSTAEFAFIGLLGYWEIYMQNCILASTTLSSGFNGNQSTGAGCVQQSFIMCQKDGQVPGAHRFINPFGIGKTDTVIFHSASPSLRLTPNSAATKMVSAPLDMGVKCAVASGGTVTPSVWVRESVAGDGAAYNGNPARLIVRRNVGAGITTDTVLATLSGGTGSWVQLTGTTAAVSDDAVLEFIVDCDGTTGWINVDDWSA